MIRLIRTYDFSTTDFFNCVEGSLTKEIQKARNSTHKIKITDGIRYRINGKDENSYTDVLINKFKRDKLYSATFTSMGEKLTVNYATKNTNKGCQITLTETVHSYNPSMHNKLANIFYRFIYYRSALIALNKLTDQVKESIKK